ncbi:MAG: penicillin acylase family protein, partial [Gemmatimonadaceae bacterium]
MKKISLLLVAGLSFSPTRNIDYTPAEMARWQQQAESITIIRDDWGIAHVYGHTDADAVFGAIYAQAEDDFNRIETNYMTNLGRTAIDEGESAVWKDLRAKLFINDDSLKAMYKGAPVSMKALMDAWANGLNFYLAKHPDVHPKSIQKFEPWMALSF